MTALRSPVVLAGAAMTVLPFALLAGGLTMTSATEPNAVSTMSRRNRSQYASLW